MASNQEPWLLENGNLKGLSKEIRHGRTAHNMSSSSLRKKSDLKLVSKVPCSLLRRFLANLQEVILGTKLSVLFPAIPLAIVAQCFGFGRPWIFALSLLGLTPLAERVSFLTEQIAYYTGPTVGGLLNATCGNATEMIIAIFALAQGKIEVVKYSLLGSILSNLLLDASDSWGLSVSFLSIILLPIVGNAAEHAGAIIFAFKNKLDITLGVALGSATQIAMFVVPLCVVVAWIMGIKMDLNFNLLETGSLALAIIATAFTLQDGTSHYMKGFVLLLCYLVIGACFFVSKTPLHHGNSINLGSVPKATDTLFGSA
ncbi:Sodium/calcium exchanger membrane region [Trema orientale]|uniref:Sodium/calcium exchanger membrane region n=1 Tax=Trema orientale TaxID=63057 RepID=A0A2P5F4G0_TREOI|nr:Sodium/calcium exchanger membrane region [Trema orientale]